jgi:hypothetical protein
MKQDRIAATVYLRADGDWNVHLLLLDDAILSMLEVGVELPLAESMKVSS